MRRIGGGGGGGGGGLGEVEEDGGEREVTKVKSTGCQIADPLSFVFLLVHKLSFMGLNRLEEEDEDVEGGASGGYLPQDAWQRVANRAQCCFRNALSFHYK